MSNKENSNPSGSQEPYPKVLIVGESFHTKSGGGITQSNLFKYWPQDKLAIIPYLRGNSDPLICKRIYNLNEGEVKYKFPFGLITKVSQKIKKNGNKIAESDWHSKSVEHNKPVEISNRESNKLNDNVYNGRITHISIFNTLRRIYRPFIGFLGIEHVKNSLVVTSELLKWIDDFGPQVIYAQFATLDKILFVQDLKTRTNLPLVIHFMDDWPSILVSPGLFRRYWERRIDKELRKLIDSADVCIAISKKMADEYQHRYDKVFNYIHNPVDIDNWLPFSKKSWGKGSTFKILYAGRAGRSITGSIKAITDIVQDLSIQKYAIQFHIYTKDYIDAALVFKNNSAVHVHKPIPDYNKIPQLFSSHDLLLIPLDFNSKFLRLSMPTKVSEYMISGTPVMVFAPRNTALAEYALNYEWAYVIDNDKEVIRKAILDLYHNESTRRRLGLKAKELAVSRHNATMIRSDFKNLLSLHRNYIKEEHNDN